MSREQWTWQKGIVGTVERWRERADDALDRLQRVLTSPEPVRTARYGGTVTPDCQGLVVVHLFVPVTTGAAFTMAAPINGDDGAELWIEFRNSSGGAMGAVTWNASYVFDPGYTWAGPGNLQSRTVGFYKRGASWFQLAASGGGGGGGGGVGGSGTAGTLPKFSAATTLADSIVSESGGVITVSAGTDASSQLRVGVGGAAPTVPRTATLLLDAPHDADVGGAYAAFARNGTVLWYAGIDPSTVGKPAGNADFMLQRTDGTNVFGVDANGNLKLAGGLDLGTPLPTAEIADNAVTYAKIQDVSATDRLLGRDTAGAGDIEELTPAAVRTMLDVPTNAEAILDALMDAKGDLIVATAADTPARLAVGTDGQVLTADSAQAAGVKWAAGGAGAWTTVKKTADQSKASDTTLAADSALVASLSAGTKYAVRAFIVFFCASAVPDFQYDLNFTGTTNAFRSQRRHAPIGQAAGTDAENTIGSQFILGATSVTATTSGIGYVELNLIVDVNTAGTLQFRWAQNTSDANNLTVLAGSYLEYMAI